MTTVEEGVVYRYQEGDVLVSRSDEEFTLLEVTRRVKKVYPVMYVCSPIGEDIVFHRFQHELFKPAWIAKEQLEDMQRAITRAYAFLVLVDVGRIQAGSPRYKKEFKEIEDIMTEAVGGMEELVGG